MTSGYPEMTKMIQEVAAELNYSVTIVEGILDEAALKVKRLIETDKYEVVVSRAGTAKLISKITDLPVVYSDSGHFNLMEAFIRAKKLGEKICFVTYPETGFLFDFERIFKIIGFKVTILPYTNQHELIEQIKTAKEMGMDVVVGGGIKTASLAKNYGMKSMYLTISKRTIKRALVLANKVAQDRILIKKRAEILNAVFNSSEEGIFLINDKEKIEMFNPTASRIFEIDEREVIGKNIDEITDFKLKELLNKKIIYKDKGNITFQNLFITHEPVIVEKEKVGTVVTCREFSKIQKLENKVRHELHSKGLIARSFFNDIYFKSKKMHEVIEQAKLYASTNSTVLIIGESGTGKELIAQAIHNESKRKDGPFVAVNCAALPENLLESELFGYAEGAFTGASKGGKQGLFELAHGGTIFLDEIGEISPYIQTRLLRVLQEKEIMRVGGDRIIPVDIRIVAATNQKLWNLVKEGKFRSDLYFRLNVLHIQIPPLRQRREDIPLLVNRYFEKLCSKIRFENISKQLQNFFLSYDWPGNIRQLENIVERLYLRFNSIKDEEKFIQEIMVETENFENKIDLDDYFVIPKGTIEEVEKHIIQQMLKQYNNNRTLVAEKLGISRTTLWKKLNS